MAKEIVRYRDEDGSTVKDWVPVRTGSALIDVSDSATISDVQTGYGMDLLRVKIPATPVGTALAIHACNTVDGTYVAVQNDAAVALSIPIVTGNKGKWVAMDTLSAMCRGMTFFKFVSNDTETADQTIEYVLG